MANDISLPTYYNNPGALIPNPQWENAHHYWDGQVGISPEGLAIFDTPESGHKALDSDLKSAIKAGHDTIRKLTKFYAGTDPDATNTALQNKMKLMVARSGLPDENTPIDLDKHLSGIHKATADFEVGTWSPEDIKQVSLRGAPQENNQGANASLPPASNQDQVNADQAEHPGKTVDSSTTPQSTRKAEKNMVSAAGALYGGATSLGLQGIGAGVHSYLANKAARSLLGTDINFQNPDSLQRYLNSQWQFHKEKGDPHTLYLDDLERAIKANRDVPEDFTIRSPADVQEAIRLIKRQDPETVFKERYKMGVDEQGNPTPVPTGNFEMRQTEIPAISMDEYATPYMRRKLMQTGSAIKENVLPTAAKFGAGVFGGAIGAPSAVQAVQSFRDQDYPYMAAKGTEALGGLLMALPFKSSIYAGTALAGLGGLSSAALKPSNQVSDISQGITNVGMLGSVAPQISEAAPQLLAPSIGGALGKIGAGILSAPAQGALMALTPSDTASNEEEMEGMGASYKNPFTDLSSYMPKKGTSKTTLEGGSEIAKPTYEGARGYLEFELRKKLAQMNANQPPAPQQNAAVNTMNMMGSGDFTP